MEDKIQESAQTNDSEVKETDTVVAGEVADTSNDAQFTDTEDTGSSEAVNNESSKTDEAVKQEPKTEEVNKSTKTNADYARERRKAEQEKAIKKARYDAIIEALDGENPYTHEKIEDERDVEEYLTMKQIAKDGKDPIIDYPKFIKNKAREQEKIKQAESSQKEWIANDRDEFVNKHPDVNLKELLEDDLFKSFALGKVGKFSMDKIYGDYQNFLSLSEERAKNRAAQILANNASSPGRIENQAPQGAKRISDMTNKEFEALTERVKRGEKISL